MIFIFWNKRIMFLRTYIGKGIYIGQFNIHCAKDDAIFAFLNL